jgi:ATP-dependent DNA ligase
MSLRERTRPGLGIIEPCLPSPAKAPPSGSGWIHEIKHDGFCIMARRDGAGVRLITRHGNDFTSRFPLAVEALQALPGRSFLIDGEAICTDESGLAVFELIRRARHGDTDRNWQSGELKTVHCIRFLKPIFSIIRMFHLSGCHECSIRRPCSGKK